MIKEIGSDYNKTVPDFGSGFVFPINGSLVFSGRTAIEMVLKEIKGAKNALLPSYCCDSMIQPFRDMGINVEFYPVTYEDGLKMEIDIPPHVDVLLWCNYFGFELAMPDFSRFKGLIIEDITHSLLSVRPYHFQSHYLVASLRKWEPINCGGYCAAVAGILHNEPTLLPPQRFLYLKTTAMTLKTEYLMKPDENNKTKIISLFKESNSWFSDSYSMLSIDQESRDYLASVDMGKQRQIRRRNAVSLYKGLEGKVRFLFDLNDMDCPLFVPVLLENRDEIRRHLINNKIYCPVHWPKPKGCESNLYNLELSLVCDQRYDIEDMERIISVMLEVL